MHTETLRRYGWDIHWESRFALFCKDGYEPGRVLAENRHHFKVYTSQGEIWAEVSGRFRFEADDRETFPAVGDWIALRRPPGENAAIIEAVLPRKSQFVRKVPGRKTEAQVVAANMDWIFVMMSLNRDFSLRRLERYLVLAWDSGVQPVVVLTKSDLCNDKEAAAARVYRNAPGTPVHVVSALTGEGLHELGTYLTEGKTIALLGSSGVGKSTLANELLGKASLKIQPIREHDDCGRHTTTARQLILLPCGAILLDTPGMRELQLWKAEDGIQAAFTEIEILARECRFRNCTHTHEPRCAVREALTTRNLDEKRFESYRKLKGEMNYLNLRKSGSVERLERQRWKKLSLLARDRAIAKRETE